jgi:hypothetical protein
MRYYAYIAKTNFLFQFQKYLHLNYHRMLMSKLMNLCLTLFKHMTTAGYRMTTKDLLIAGKLHITIYGKISLVPTLTLMWSNGLYGGHLQLVDSYRHVHYTSEIHKKHLTEYLCLIYDCKLCQFIHCLAQRF